MTLPRPLSWLPIAGVLAAVAGGLVWLLLVFAPRGEHIEPWAASLTDGPTLEFYAEPSPGRMTPADVTRLPATAWRHWTSARFYASGYRTTLWARVTVRNATAQPQQGILADADYFADRVEAWIVGPDGVVAPPLLSGETVTADAKIVPGREVAFPIDLPAQGERVIYLRAQDYFVAFCRLEWWPETTRYQAVRRQRTLAEVVYFGGLFALLGYNVLLWLRLRLKDIGYYVLYLGATAAFMLLARAQHLELGWAFGSPGLEAALIVALALSGMFLTRFAHVYLELKIHLPRGHRVALGLGAFMLAIAVGAACTPRLATPVWLSAVAAGSGLTHLCLLALALAAWRAGARQARFFVLSFGCLFAGSVPLATVWFVQVNFKATALMGLMIGSALEMLLLSLAVADRFAQAQRERTAAQEKLLAEAEQRRLIEAAYADELEIEVRERTRELETANTDKDRMLIALGHDLRSPVAALTQRAELLRATRHGAPAPAEELADFSGDVAGAGRQILLLIEDIVLWARLRTGSQPALSAHALKAVVHPVVRLYEPAAARRGVTLTVRVDESLVVSTDLVLAQTIVRNLVGNALKFARHRVEIATFSGGALVGLSVRDDGPGLPPEMQARFRRESPADGEAAEGGGMGLRLCQEIGATLGATLRAAVLPSGGTEMQVIFPPNPDSAMKAPA